MRMAILRVSGAVAAWSLLLAMASATGYWNLPCNFCQCLGCGYGPGYHAPVVLGPMSCKGLCYQNVIRTPSAPVPCYGSAHDCSSPVFDSGALGGPSMLEADIAPVVPDGAALVTPAARTSDERLEAVPVSPQSPGVNMLPSAEYQRPAATELFGAPVQL